MWVIQHKVEIIVNSVVSFITNVLHYGNNMELTNILYPIINSSLIFNKITVELIEK